MPSICVALDFAALPPEVNSARMYSGAGSGPMLAAAAAWNGLAAEMQATLSSYRAVLSALIEEQWFGPASASMAAAAMPYVDWMSMTAARAELSACQAEAAAGAYEAAFAATVAPSLVATNRAQLATLVSTNVLGQNSAAIAATEAQYVQMWAQDAAAMYGYAGSSAAASELSPFDAPGQTSGAAAGQQSTLARLITDVPGALQSLSGVGGNSSLTDISNLLTGSTGLSNVMDATDVMDMWGPNANIWNTITSTGLLNPGATVGTLADALGRPAVTEMAGATDVAPGAVAAAAQSTGGGLRSMVTAAAGGAGLIGKMSVPPGWTSASPLVSPLHSALGGTPMIAPPPAAGAGMPAVPLANPAGQPYGRAVPQYGFRPSFVVRPPAAG